MLTSFNPLLRKYQGSTYSHMVCQWSKGKHYAHIHHIVWKDFFLKAFHDRWGTNLLGKFTGEVVLHEVLMIRSCQWSFTNAFSSNLKTLNFKLFANHEYTGYTLEDKALASVQNYRRIYS